MKERVRPLTTLGVALVSAGMLVAGPAVSPAVRAEASRSVDAVNLLASPAEIWDSLNQEISLVSLLQLSVLPSLLGGDFDFSSLEGVQEYIAAATDWLEDTGATAVQWAGIIDQWISPLGISGIDDWASGQYDLFISTLLGDFDAAALVAEISADPSIFFNPIAEFDLGWLYGLFGAPEEAYSALDDLLGLQSSLISGDLSQLLWVTVAPVGLVAQVLAGNLDLTESDAWEPLFTVSWEELVQPVEESINGQIQDIVGTLDGVDGVGWLLDLLNFFG